MSDNLMNRARALGLHGLIAHWDEVGECDWLTMLIAWEEEERRARSLKRRLADARLGEFNPSLTLAHACLRETGGGGAENQDIAEIIARYRPELHRYMHGE